MNTIPITREGYENLKKELERLLKVERPANVKAIETARAHGDLSENAEFHAAKERQSFIEGRVNELQVNLGRCEIIDIGGAHDRAVFGARVTVQDIETEEEKVFTLVGPLESAPEKGRISVVSPLGKALIGKEEGDEIQVQTPGGIKQMEIISIE